MVFARVHLIKGRLSTAQKDELGAKLIQAVSDVEGLADDRIQVDVVVPQKLVSSPQEDRNATGKVTEAVRSVLGDDLLPAHGPRIHLYVLPLDQFAIDGRIPDWDGYRAGQRLVTNSAGASNGNGHA